MVSFPDQYVSSLAAILPAEIYILTSPSMSAMSLFKDSNFNKDDVPRPYDISTISDTSYISSSWSPYPRHNGRRRECLEVFLNEQLKLAEICDDINHLLFRKEPHTLSINLELWRSADQAAERLHQWNDHLPESLALKDGPPHFLNLRYHNLNHPA